MPTETWAHKLTITRNMPDGQPVEITAGLHHLAGNKRPYFSVTCWAKPNHRKGWGEWGGAAHETILRLAPELAPVIALHLSDDDGTPMHAPENGAYHLGMTKWQGPNLTHAAEHFRITEQEAASMVPWTKEALAEWVAAQAPRWKAEAEAAVALLDQLISMQELAPS